MKIVKILIRKEWNGDQYFLEKGRSFSLKTLKLFYGRVTVFYK